MDKIITDYTKETDSNISTVSESGVAGCTANPDFTFTTQVTNVSAKLVIYKAKLAATIHGSQTDTDEKDTAKGVLVGVLKTLTESVNSQAVGDRAKLLGSGFPLAKTPTTQLMEEVDNFKVKGGVIAGTVDASVDKAVGFTTHGTMFAYWKTTDGVAPADKYFWYQHHANGTTLNMRGFTPGVDYLFSAAFKGLDTEELIWCPTITKMFGS